MRPAAALAVAVLLAACSSSASPAEPQGSIGLARSSVMFYPSDGSPVILSVLVADTDPERERGLMGVTNLASDQGMAFVFDSPTTAEFWMKNTLIPLSIAFVNQGGRVVATRDMQPCRTDSCPWYSAGQPYAFAVEAHLGYFSGSNVRLGDRAVLEAARA